MTSADFYRNHKLLERPEFNAVLSEYGYTSHEFFCDMPEAFVTTNPVKVDRLALYQWLGVEKTISRNVDNLMRSFNGAYKGVGFPIKP